jgi:hypothetical protein
MAFITFDGSQTTNQYLSPSSSHLVLSHAGLVDQLLLAEHDEKPYEYYSTGQTQADGRSLQGSIRLKGNNWNKGMWECNFLALAPQIDLFNQLVQSQQVTTPVALIDRWIDGALVSKSVWIQLDRQYLSLVAGNSWWRLQFQLWEV